MPGQARARTAAAEAAHCCPLRLTCAQLAAIALSRARAQLCQRRRAPCAQAAPLDGTLPEEALLPYLFGHGRRILARSSLQDGLCHFLLPGVGYIAYALMHRGPEVLRIFTPVALGDPLCAPEAYVELTAAFLRAHPRAMFAQVRGPKGRAQLRTRTLQP